MKIICLVKFVPDIDNFIYDYEKNVLVRENVRMILNPDDACALAFALKIREKRPDVFLEAVTMAPRSITPQLEDLLRLGVDQVSLISDPLYVGSDTYVTSRILGRYLRGETFDCILSGTGALDGDTSHVPSQIAELLGLSQMSNVSELDEDTFSAESAVITVDEETAFSRYKVSLPAVISLQRGRKYKLPYIRYADINRNVRDRITVVGNNELGFSADEIGIKGSLTKITRTFVQTMEKKNKITVDADEEGVDTVYTFLKEKGFV